MIDPQNETRTKADFMKSLAKSLLTLDEEMEPFKEQKKDLKKEYKENNWLSKEEISAVQTAISMWKKVKKGSLTIDEFLKAFEIIDG